MSQLSDDAENKVLSLVLRNTGWTVTNVYIALHTSSPGDTGANEVSAGWYARKAITFNAATTSGATNDGQVDFDEVTGSGLTITHVSLWDADTSGNMIWWKALSSQRALSVGATPILADDALTVTAGGGFSNYLIPKIIDHALGTAAYTPAATVYLALYTSNPTAADSGSEATLGDYARSAIAFDAPSSGVTQNTDEEDFGTASSGPNTITHWGIRDASTDGNLLIFGEWNDLNVVDNGDVYKVPAGSLTITAA